MDEDNINMKIGFKQLDIILVLLQIVMMLGFEIEYLETSLSGIYLVCCLVISVSDIEDFLILYYKLFQLV